MGFNYDPTYDTHDSGTCHYKAAGTKCVKLLSVSGCLLQQRIPKQQPVPGLGKISSAIGYVKESALSQDLFSATVTTILLSWCTGANCVALTQSHDLTHLIF